MAGAKDETQMKCKCGTQMGLSHANETHNLYLCQNCGAIKSKVKDHSK